MEKKIVLEVKNLSFGYGTNQVLSNLNFKVFEGEYAALIGANGSGKTTLLKLILGLLLPSSGKVLMLSESLKSFKSWSKIGYVPQLVSSEILGFPITVKECILLNYSSQNQETQKSALERVLKITDTQNLQNKLLSDLSGGQRQRVFIARSLINNPVLLILDEPTSGIDQESQLGFYKLLTKLNQDFGLTVLFVSHDLETISTQANRILCVDRNKLEEKLPTLNHLHSHQLKESQIEHIHV